MTEGLAVPSHSSESAPEPPLSSVGEALTFRAVFCAIILGSVVCFANTYFGLQAGTVNAMPMQTSLLAFALFRSIQHRISKSLSPEETTVIEIIAGALGLAPFTSGFTGPIPALEFLTTPVENGPKRFSAAQLIQWSIATCALGTVLAVPFRRLFILRECLRYPSATATGTLIGVLFGKETIVARAQQFGPPEYHPLVADTDSDLPEAASEDRTSDHLNTNSPHEVAVNVLIMSFSGSALFVSGSHEDFVKSVADVTTESHLVLHTNTEEHAHIWPYPCQRLAVGIQPFSSIFWLWHHHRPKYQPLHSSGGHCRMGYPVSYCQAQRMGRGPC